MNKPNTKSEYPFEKIPLEGFLIAEHVAPAGFLISTADGRRKLFLTYAALEQLNDIRAAS